MNSGSPAERTATLFVTTGSGKSLLSALLIQRASRANRSVGVLRRDIAVLDGMHRQLTEETHHLASTLGISAAIEPGLADDPGVGLLRLVDDIRAVLRLMLIRVLSALSRRPDRLDFVLILLASCRSYGHRGEPADHALPALTSMLAVIGEAARSR
jgi:hypothetical protein